MDGFEVQPKSGLSRVSLVVYTGILPKAKRGDHKNLYVCRNLAYCFSEFASNHGPTFRTYVAYIRPRGNRLETSAVHKLPVAKSCTAQQNPSA